jgi:hypothetical protein
MSTPVLAEPKYTAKDVVLNPTFKWPRVLNATSYRLQLSSDQNYVNVVVDTTIADTAFALSKPLQTGSYYYWHIKARNAGAETGWSARWPFLTTYVSAVKEDKEEKDQQVREYSLKQNYPNPFNPSTVITYSLAKDGYVRLSVFDVLGNEVAVLAARYQTAGSHSMEFDAGRFGLTSGIYFYTLKAGGFVSTKKMIMVK